MFFCTLYYPLLISSPGILQPRVDQQMSRWCGRFFFLAIHRLHLQNLLPLGVVECSNRSQLRVVPLWESKTGVCQKELSFLTAAKQSSDELTISLNTSLSTDYIEFFKNDEEIISYWVNQRESIPVLHICALQIYISPASFTPSDSNCSLLKLMMTPGRNMVKDDIIYATAKLRCALLE